MDYALKTTTFDTKQCGKFNTALRSAFVAPMGMNRHYPKAILCAPVDYGGMNFPEVESLQLQTQTEYWIRQLRWDGIVANDFRVTLERVQLVSGCVTPVMEDASMPLDHMKSCGSYVVSLRDRLGEIGAGMWLEGVWTPKLQRDNDRSIMATTHALGTASKPAMERINEVRIYLRVITIADLVDATGKFIEADLLSGEWRAGSDLQWPKAVSYTHLTLPTSAIV